MKKEFNTQYWSYGIYDNEANNYRLLFTCRNDAQAKRQFIAHAVGTNDLFNETLELHKLDRIGNGIGEVENDFIFLMSYSDIDASVQLYREKTSKMINK